jgi:hypothetical protein
MAALGYQCLFLPILRRQLLFEICASSIPFGLYIGAIFASYPAKIVLLFIGNAAEHPIAIFVASPWGDRLLLPKGVKKVVDIDRFIERYEGFFIIILGEGVFRLIEGRYVPLEHPFSVPDLSQVIAPNGSTNYETLFWPQNFLKYRFLTLKITIALPEWESMGRLKLLSRLCCCIMSCTGYTSTPISLNTLCTPSVEPGGNPYYGKRRCKHEDYGNLE